MWKTRRRAAALAQAAVILVIPFVRAGGESALRFDVEGLRLFFLGTVLWIDEFHLVLPGLLLLIAVFLGATAVFGRVWCGWMCGQTLLPLLAEWAAEALPPRFRARGARVLLLPFSAIVSLSILCCFLPPSDVAASLPRSSVLLGFFLVIGGTVYALAALAGPGFCRTVCPYAMLQNVLFDGDTLTIGFDGARAADCFRCDLCVHRCPVGIDIKSGLRRECIACAECIDACGEMTAPRGVEPFVAYRGRIRRRKAAALGGAALAAAAALAVAVSLRPDVSLSAQLEGALPRAGAGIYRLTFRNRGPDPVRLAAAAEDGTILSGPRAVAIPPRTRTTERFVVRGSAGGPGTATLVFTGGSVRIREMMRTP